MDKKVKKESKSTALALAPSEEALALLKQNFPQPEGFTRVLLPRIKFVSQDKFEGKGKDKKVSIVAGTFFEERETDELDENEKKIWASEELGDSMDGVIIYVRKQLRMYDEKTEEYTSSPIFDTKDDVVPLFCNKKEVGRGTPADLKKKYMYLPKGADKERSALEENDILYVLRGIEDKENEPELFQFNLRGSSMWSFRAYTRKTLPPAVITNFSSTAEENGDIEWNKVSFTPERMLTNDEVTIVMQRVAEIKQAIADEKAFFADAGATAEDVAGEGKKKGDEDDDF